MKRDFLIIEAYLFGFGERVTDLLIRDGKFSAIASHVDSGFKDVVAASNILIIPNLFGRLLNRRRCLRKVDVNAFLKRG